MKFPKGCHAVRLSDLDSLIKITQPTTLYAVERQLGVAKREDLIAIRPRGTCKWTVYNSLTIPVASGKDLDVLRAKAALLGWYGG